ncbi:MAG: hypothetical protein ACYTG7_13800 [Planctomycetota bacterium]|jgi:hypothetical protein
MELIGYTFLIIVALCYLGAMIFGFIQAWPYGLIGFIALTGIGFLFIKVVVDRLSSREDDYYADNVDK